MLYNCFKTYPMKPKDFVSAYLPFAKIAEEKTGISAVAILAQGALESGWGTAVVGNSFFGVKSVPGALDADKQLITTTEYSRRIDLKFPVILSVTPVVRNGIKMFKYSVKDYFEKYDSPAQCFEEHGNFFIENSRYKAALAVKSDPVKFLTAVAKAGYATDPNYADVLTKIVGMIQANI